MQPSIEKRCFKVRGSIITEKLSSVEILAAEIIGMKFEATVRAQDEHEASEAIVKAYGGTDRVKIEDVGRC